VRHPIYTGIIVALSATAVLKASPLGIAGVFLMTYGFWVKAKLEERFLSEQLGAEAYGAYRRKVPMLVPFGQRPA
jgi:protein-S-isoprenylcysteine O-methyltransferase Ste14